MQGRGYFLCLADVIPVSSPKSAVRSPNGLSRIGKPSTVALALRWDVLGRRDGSLNEEGKDDRVHGLFLPRQ